ncbi:MAG: hypothetical protein WC325_05020 [Candidatus Bathyarchaeia archaeon]|jgi:hypothetical protein
MGESVMKVVSGYTKNKLIAFFLLLWGASFFFNAISGFLWLTRANEPVLEFLVDVLYYLAQLGGSAVLVMLGLKFKDEPTAEA